MQVYFVQQGNTDLIKIGTSNNVPRRLRELQTASPQQLLLLGVMEGDRNIEKEIHQKFMHLRQNKEWFKLDSELSTFISKNCEFEDRPIFYHKKRKF